MPRIVLPRPLALLCLALALILAATLAQAMVAPVAAQAAIATPKTKVFAAGIDAYGSYQGQETCSGSVKPGAQATKDLLNSTYGTRTIGIVRNCSSGGTSEHKEGRALDWMISVRNASQKATADSFIAWLLATDKYGNKHAMVRRMGIMYIIWNNKMWRAYDPGRGWSEYKGCSSTTSTGYDTTCHRDHVHLSFTWDGANAKTSFYTGSVQFRVAADISRSTAKVNETVTISGNVSPVVGAVGKRVAIKQVLTSGYKLLGYAAIDSSGRYSYPFTLPSSGTFRFLAYKTAEGCANNVCAYGSGVSPTVAVKAEGSAQVPFAIELSASPTTVPDGWPVTFTGRVSPANVSAGLTASLKRYDPATGGAAVHLGSVPIKSDGTFDVDYVPTETGSGEYFIYKSAEVCGGPDGCAYVSAISAKVTVDVRDSVKYSVSAKAATSTVPVGGAVRVSGSVGPSWAAPGTSVQIRDVVGDVATRVGAAVVDAKGTFSLDVRPSTVGVHNYQAFKPSDDCTGSSCDFTSAWSPIFRVEALKLRPFTASAGAEYVIQLNQPLTVRATFGPADASRGVKVALQERKSGAWVKIGSRVADANGRVELATKYGVAGTRHFRFVAAPAGCSSGVCLYTGGTSGTLSVTAVKPNTKTFAITSAMTPLYPKSGAPVTVTGKIAPANVVAGQPVSLQRMQAGVWTYVKSAAVRSDGTFTIGFSASGSGKQYYRVAKSKMGCTSTGCTWVFSAGPVMRLTVN